MQWRNITYEKIDDEIFFFNIKGMIDGKEVHICKYDIITKTLYGINSFEDENISPLCDEDYNVKQIIYKVSIIKDIHNGIYEFFNEKYPEFSL